MSDIVPSRIISHSGFEPSPTGIREEWHGRANCGRNGIIGDDPAARVKMMYPGEGGVPPLWVCDGCPVFAECEALVKTFKPTDIQGLWAGVAQSHRRYRSRTRVQTTEAKLAVRELLADGEWHLRSELYEKSTVHLSSDLVSKMIGRREIDQSIEAGVYWVRLAS